MIQDNNLSKQIGSNSGIMSLKAKAISTRFGWARDWQHWSPYAALAWSLIYTVLGLYWVFGGRGFPYSPETASDEMVPLVVRLGPVGIWIIVIAAGFLAVVMGAAMLRGVRGKILRPLIITAGALLAGVLLLFMIGLDLLIKVGYLPSAIFGLFNADQSQLYVGAWKQSSTIHQLFCLLGGFLWLAATISYARRSGDACLYCGRSDRPEGWASPNEAKRWGRIAVIIAIMVPIFYAFTRITWAMGIPLGMTEEYYRQGQENGTWIGGLSLAIFCLVGGLLMLGLIQRWGEVFPRWMIGLARRRVPVALAVVPASLASVLLFVGGIGIWSGLPQMVANMEAIGAAGAEITGMIIFQLGPTLLFPVWGAALAVATLGYYYRRRGPCSKCGRGI